MSRERDIETLLNELNELWALSPDLRLGQLLINLISKNGHKEDYLYFINDEKLLDIIKDSKKALYKENFLKTIEH